MAKVRKRKQPTVAKSPVGTMPLIMQVIFMLFSLGLEMVPIWSLKDGRCQCGKKNCLSPGKHPDTRHHPDHKMAIIREVNRALKLARKHPRMNWAVRTGRLVAIDVDKGRGGLKLLKQLEKKYGKLPVTVKYRTGGGGLHIWFWAPAGVSIKSIANALGGGIDVRAEGGIAIVPGSTHVSGNKYKFIKGCRPDQVPIASLPDWLLDLLPKKDDEVAVQSSGNRIGVGNRNDTLTRIAGFLRRLGLSLKLIDRSLQGVNEAICDPELTKSEVSGIAKSVAQYEPGEGISHPPQEPFPIHLFPDWLTSFLATAAKAMGCDVSMIAPHVLAVAAAAIGNSRRILLKNSWSEPSVIWIFVIAESGTLKSPGYELAIHPVVVHQEAAMVEYRQKLKAWQDLSPEEQHTTPKPRAKRYLVSDTTIEAIVSLLNYAHRGLLLAADEIAGFIERMNAYSSNGKGEESSWLTMHRAGPLMQDRKTGDEQTILITHAAVSVCGGIQPGTLLRLSTPSRVESGFIPRILLVLPETKAKRWTETDIDETAMRTYAKKMNRLYKLLPSRVEDDGSFKPKQLGLDDGAKELWRNFYNAHNAEAVELSGEMAARWAKLEAYAARFALIFEHLDWAFGPASKNQPSSISRKSMASGIELYRWFANETKRVHGFVEAESNVEQQGHAIEQIVRLGGSATARDLARSSSRYSPTKKAQEVLDALVKTGIGRWKQIKAGDKGGRPTKRFVLID